MRRAMCLSLVVILLIGQGAVRAGLKAGAATSNITPHLGTSLDGTIQQNGPAVQIHDELHVRAMVLDDGITRIAMVVVDSTMVDRSVYDEAKAIIEERCGLTANRVLVSATHTHATPRLCPGLTDNPLNAEYAKFMARRIADAVESSIDRLMPAKIGWGSIDKPEFVHNRRWFVEPASMSANPFGKKTDKVKMNPGKIGLIKPAGPVDPEVFILSLQHADGRPLALLANYGLHYVGGYQRGRVSADYYGVFAERVRKGLTDDSHRPPFVGIMSNGTSGDVNANDMTKPREKSAPWERMRVVAEKIAEGVIELYPSIEHRADVTLGMVEKEMSLEIRKPDEHLIEWAKNNYVAKPSKGKNLTRPQVYARETLRLAEYPDRIPIVLQAIRIGDLGIVAIPCETFAETGLAIKERSPFKSTFAIELANGADGYLPTPEQHAWGGYETWPARSSLLEVGAEPKIREAVLGMLGELAPES